jgi:hypothetical protein
VLRYVVQLELCLLYVYLLFSLAPALSFLIALLLSALVCVHSHAHLRAGSIEFSEFKKLMLDEIFNPNFEY